MRIIEVVLVEVSGEFAVEGPFSEERRVDPLDVYREFNRSFSPYRPEPGARARHRDLFLEIRTDEGVTGLFGPVDGPHATIVPREMRGLLIGRDPLAIEAIWDVLLRRDRHARGGYYMMAMSAVDCALWDLKGKALGLPVYRLLGGPVQEPVRAYASMLGFSIEPEALARRAREHQALGYHAQKWFFRHGPADGGEGASRNVAMVRAAREAVGDDAALMFDAFNSWDVPYAVDIGRRIAGYRPAWLEEPVPCDRIEALRAIRERAGVPIATGEHLYSRWQVRDLLDAEAVDVIQADPDWCGGITELLKIATVCSAYGVPLCPHGHSLHAALHVAAALPATVLPQVEFLILHQPHKQRFMRGDLQPEGGVLRPPEAPGLGIELDEAKIDERREIC
ncbi:MAG: mandelate racemase/muconate lactonizing enzyme family protein [Armatimonadetes bacterium]|nr:mandelate racemase/muconate lactonizing enzyme family protein [Armatimonadota bacterium]